MSFWAKYAPDQTEYYLPDPSDPEKKKLTPYYWRILAPSFAAERRLAAYLSSEEYRTTPEICMEELSLTFGGTNFPAADSPTFDPADAAFKPALAPDASAEQIKAFIDTLPPQIVIDIWEKLKEVAPNWGPRFKRSV
jgi:hypothetical protein